MYCNTIYPFSINGEYLKRGGKCMKNVQISEQLFVELVKYFLLDVQDDKNTKYICKGLSDKMDAIIKRDLYTKYKTAVTPEEQEKARLEYLDMIGMSESFRY